MTSDFPVTAWTAAHLARLGARPFRTARTIMPEDIRPAAPGLDIWDLWPVQEDDGSVAKFEGAELWLTLAASARGDPVERHGRARIHQLARDAGGWRDLGSAFPDGWSPGSREWSGSAIVDADHRAVTIHFTAAGRRGEQPPTFEQRLFQAEAELISGRTGVRLGSVAAPIQSLVVDTRLYDPANQAEGVAGRIKAFRDPGFFRDPADGTAYLLFAASLPRGSSEFNGAVGLARAVDGSRQNWSILPPIVHADGVNNELERPHLLFHDGLYYLFWSTQAEVFAPGGPKGPTGLYGMVGRSPRGPYEPLNGSGLVLANPERAPFQAYSWLVADDLSVSSFINYIGVAGPEAPQGMAARAVFGGAPAPLEHIRLEGNRAW